jgi:hypothetical protein
MTGVPACQRAGRFCSFLLMPKLDRAFRFIPVFDFGVKLALPYVFAKPVSC